MRITIQLFSVLRLTEIFFFFLRLLKIQHKQLRYPNKFNIFNLIWKFKFSKSIMTDEKCKIIFFDDVILIVFHICLKNGTVTIQIFII